MILIIFLWIIDIKLFIQITLKIYNNTLPYNFIYKIYK
jgi:hypothetical protein